VLSTLKTSGITLSLGKYYFTYPNIALLGHYISRLGIATAKEKIVAVRKIAFPEKLGELESVLAFIGYYRKYIEHYGGRAKLLEELKTYSLKQAPRKG
jgi:hypothetical protein